MTTMSNSDDAVYTRSIFSILSWLQTNDLTGTYLKLQQETRIYLDIIHLKLLIKEGRFKETELFLKSYINTNSIQKVSIYYLLYQHAFLEYINNGNYKKAQNIFTKLATILLPLGENYQKILNNNIGLLNQTTKKNIKQSQLQRDLLYKHIVALLYKIPETREAMKFKDNLVIDIDSALSTKIQNNNNSNISSLKTSTTNINTSNNNMNKNNNTPITTNQNKPTINERDSPSPTKEDEYVQTKINNLNGNSSNQPSRPPTKSAAMVKPNISKQEEHIPPQQQSTPLQPHPFAQPPTTPANPSPIPPTQPPSHSPPNQPPPTNPSLQTPLVPLPFNIYSGGMSAMSFTSNQIRDPRLFNSTGTASPPTRFGNIPPSDTQQYIPPANVPFTTRSPPVTTTTIPNPLPINNNINNTNTPPSNINGINPSIREDPTPPPVNPVINAGILFPKSILQRKTDTEMKNINSDVHLVSTNDQIFKIRQVKKYEGLPKMDSLKFYGDDNLFVYNGESRYLKIENGQKEREGTLYTFSKYTNSKILFINPENTRGNVDQFMASNLGKIDLFNLNSMTPIKESPLSLKSMWNSQINISVLNYNKYNQCFYAGCTDGCIRRMKSGETEAERIILKTKNGDTYKEFSRAVKFIEFQDQFMYIVYENSSVVGIFDVTTLIFCDEIDIKEPIGKIEIHQEQKKLLVLGHKSFRVYDIGSTIPKLINSRYCDDKVDDITFFNIGGVVAKKNHISVYGHNCSLDLDTFSFSEEFEYCKCIAVNPLKKTKEFVVGTNLGHIYVFEWS